jgi:hypothetical protein
MSRIVQSNLAASLPGARATRGWRCVVQSMGISKFAAAASLMIAAFLVPVAVHAISGGGTVSNVVPTVVTMTPDLTALNVGSDGVLSGTVRDYNGETDLSAIKLETTSGPTASSTHAIVAGDISGTTEPANFDGSGWKVWNTGGADGILSFKFDYTYGTVGTYVWTPSVKDVDAGAVFQLGSTVSVTAQAAITFATNPVVTAAGVTSTASWGSWTAAPGGVATGINYIKVVNSGVNPTQEFIADFTDASFTGVTDATKTIAINNNISFTCFEGASTAIPSDLVASPLPASSCQTSGPGGSVTATFSGTGKVIFIVYSITALPAVMMDQTYTATFTIGAV